MLPVLTCHEKEKRQIEESVCGPVHVFMAGEGGGDGWRGEEEEGGGGGREGEETGGGGRRREGEEEGKQLGNWN